MPSRGKAVSKIKHSAIDALSASVEHLPALVKSRPEEASGIQVIDRLYPRLRFLKEERNYNYSDLSDFLNDKLGLDLSPETVRSYMSLVKKDQPTTKRKRLPIESSPVYPIADVESIAPPPIVESMVSVDPVPIVESSERLVRAPGESDRSWVQRRLKSKRAQEGLVGESPEENPKDSAIDPYAQGLDESYGQWQVRIRQLDQAKVADGRTVLGSPRANQFETDKLFHKY